MAYKEEKSFLSPGIGFRTPDTILNKIINEDGSKYYYISATFNQPNWLFVQKIVFMFDGEPYILKAEQQQRNVVYGGGVTERYTFDINENFIKKYINAKKVRFKIYTTEQGNFENYMSGDKDDLKYGNGNKIQDKNLNYLLKASY